MKPNYFKKTPKPVSQEMPKNLSTYLGPKGYTIPKSELTADQLKYIKDTLTVRPYTPGSPMSAAVSFPAYRESTQKIYVPRFFGTEQFGVPKQVKIPEGDDIDVPFAGSLRDYQQDVVNAYTKSNSGGLVTLECGAEKTVIGLNIIYTMKKKTLIIVHK